MKRIFRHLACGAGVGLAALGTWAVGDPAGGIGRLSLLTAWLCTGFLVAALAFGPVQVLRTGRPVLNSLIRRDLGIWAALTGLAHLWLATVVVMTPVYFQTYITPADGSDPGLAGWVGTGGILAGYLVGLLFLMLLGLSSNRSLKRLGPERWKSLQRWAWPAFLLTVVHGLVFQVVEGRTGFLIFILSTVLLTVVWLRGKARHRLQS